MRKLIIFGASGHARVIADAARESERFAVLGFIDRKRATGERVDDFEVLGDESAFADIVARHPEAEAIVGIGDNDVRRQVVERIGIVRFATVIHPAAVVARDVRIEDGTFVAASATINCGTAIGAHCVVNTGACVDHDCDLGDYTFLSPGVTLAGGVRVGRSAFVGTGASVIPLMRIGNGAVVGAGAAVIDAVPDNVTVVGVPARRIKESRHSRPETRPD